MSTLTWRDVSTHRGAIFQQALVGGNLVYLIWYGVVGGHGPEPAWYMRRNSPHEDEWWKRYDSIKSVDEARAMAEVLYRMEG